MYIKRDISHIIQNGAKQAPVIAIVGPRQSGKSTLAKKLFPDHQYIDMQDAHMFEFAQTDPKGFLKTYRNSHGIIIDEAQYAPHIFAQIKVEADKKPQPGYFILSGSQNFLLHEKISESLAGRVYIYTLLPLSIHELKESHLLSDRVVDQLYKGFYPRVYQSNINTYDYYSNYISTYVERDIRTIRNIDNILSFKKCMQLCALRIGSPLNYTDLATNCGVNINTIKSWLALLETSYILFFLPPYHKNLGKRITKSPKLYFYDVGLATTMMGVDQERIINNRDIYGTLFENMIIVDIMKNCNAQHVRCGLSYYRDTNQNEIDLIIEQKGKTIPIEIKGSETIHPRFFQIGQWFHQTTQSEKPLIIYAGNTLQERTIGKVLPWIDTDTIL